MLFQLCRITHRNRYRDPAGQLTIPLGHFQNMIHIAQNPATHLQETLILDQLLCQYAIVHSWTVFVSIDIVDPRTVIIRIQTYDF